MMYADYSGNFLGLAIPVFCKIIYTIGLLMASAGAAVLTYKVAETVVQEVNDAITVPITLPNHKSEDKTKEDTSEKEIVLSKVESEKEYNYWAADLVKVAGGKTVVVGMGLTVEEAFARVAIGGSIMCRNEAAAKHIIYLNGYYNAVGPEIHNDGFPH